MRGKGPAPWNLEAWSLRGKFQAITLVTTWAHSPHQPSAKKLNCYWALEISLDGFPSSHGKTVARVRERPREKEVGLFEYLLPLLGTVLDALEILICSSFPQSCEVSFIPIL